MKRDTAIIYTVILCIAGFASYPLRPGIRPNYNYAKDGYLIKVTNKQNIHYQVTQQILPKNFNPKALQANKFIRYSRIPANVRVPQKGFNKLKTEFEYSTGRHMGYDFQSAGRILINPDVAAENGQTRVELFVDKNGTRVVCRTIDATQSPAGSVAKDKAILFEDAINLRGIGAKGDPRKSLTRQDDPKYDPAQVADDTPWTVDVTISSIGYAYFSNFSVRVNKVQRNWKLDRPDVDNAFSTAYLNALYPHITQQSSDSSGDAQPTAATANQPIDTDSAAQQPASAAPVTQPGDVAMELSDGSVTPQPGDDSDAVQQPSASAVPVAQQSSDITAQDSSATTAASDESLLPQYAWSDEVVIVQDQPTDQLHLDVLDAKGRSNKDPLQLAERLLKHPKDQYSVLQILSYLFQCENITALSAFTKKYDNTIQQLFTNLMTQQTPQATGIATTALGVLQDVYRYAGRTTDAQQNFAAIQAIVNGSTPVSGQAQSASQ